MFEAALAGAGDHFEHEAGLRVRHAGDVDDVDGRAGDGGIGDHFLKGFGDRAGLDGAGRAHVDEDCRLTIGRDLDDIEDFRMRCRGHVGDAEA